ncbi:protein translocase subunit SecF [Sporomusa sphaeroides]|uniref:Protein-export membrane protein SecF n=1 Tax=Sporomusa sphaeroides DSM 2875 TaxID=1337886 RepID=A0ABP2CA09_9FIRM|nr:protein translocase subunit SecF [Sporomusa sphaeroides]OLS58454.1 protein-export membrane protein SecF [Sporomusa sphaeroides DSM 2875]CVK19594.1 preprotein translocase subunit SecF [Sporomusa sphaeroides DSM 2875]
MNFDIVKRRKWWYLLSVCLLLPGLLSIAIQGFNLGIDFTGGTLLDLKFSRPVTVAEVRDVLKDYQLENSTIQLALTGQESVSPNVFIRSHVLNEDERRAVLKGFETKLGAFEVLRVEKVGAVVGSELTRQAVFALVISWVLMIVYITYRFEFKFAVCGILGLVHDVIITIGAFSLLQKEIDAAFVAALLTVVGYSINDTIVIFDRIRENLRNYKKNDDIEELVNRSVWQTMTRSIYTVLTVLFAAGSLYWFGGETTKNFSLALLIGIAVGAYSSIFTSSQLWVDWKEYDEKRRVEVKAKGAK